MSVGTNTALTFIYDTIIKYKISIKIIDSNNIIIRFELMSFKNMPATRVVIDILSC